MKGVVFTEFLDFVEGQTSYEVVDRMLDLADTPLGVFIPLPENTNMRSWPV